MHRDLKPPTGWKIIAGTLALDQTISGYLARDHDVRGRCYQRDCRRNCHIDHARIVEHGLGALKIDQVKTAMRCARLEGCGIEWLENPNRATLPLMVLRGRVAVKVRIVCRGCATVSLVSPETMIARLKAEGLGDDSTTIAAIPGLLKKVCACGKTAWEVNVAWPDPNSYGGRSTIEREMRKLNIGRLREPTDF